MSRTPQIALAVCCLLAAPGVVAGTTVEAGDRCTTTDVGVSDDPRSTDGIEPSPGPNVSIANVSAPSVVANGSQYTVRVTLENGRTAPAKTTVTYRRNGTVLANRAVTVPPGRSNVSLRATAPQVTEAVDHRVSVDGETWNGTLRVRRPARFVVETLGPSPAADDLPDDQPIEIRTTLVNRGGTTGTRTVVLRSEGSVVDRVNLSLAPGERTTVAREVTPPDVGRYGTLYVSVAIGDRRWNESVSIASPPTPTPTSVEPRESTTERTEPTTNDRAGSPTPEATGETSRSEPRQETPTEYVTDGGPGPGFGVVTVVLAVLCVLALWSDRR